jgi:predicted nucleic acid-binding protein
MTSETPEVVVPDTSCLIALRSLRQLSLLRQFYETPVVPPAVAREYGHNLPGWLRTRTPDDPKLLALLGATLGPGEAEVIALAARHANSLLILDDLRARRTATRMGLRVTGTVGVLLRARREGALPSLARALVAVEAVGFRVSAELRSEALRLAGERPP